MVKLNLTGVSTSPTPVDAGVVQAAFTKHDTIMESQASGQPYVNLEFTLEAPNAGRKVWSTASLQTQSLWAFKRAALALGIEEEDLEQEFDIDELLKAHYGAKVDLLLIVEKVKSKKTGDEMLVNKVAKMAPLGMLEANPVVGASPF